MRLEPQPGTPVDELDTPALLLDLDAFEHNLGQMARFFAGLPASLRPHAKTHKCPQIVLRQLQAGAIGITCAKVSEAEVMARAGVRDLLIANQVVGPLKIDRLTDLAGRCDLMVAVDDAANVDMLAQACRAKGVSLRVLVEVDVGMGRCGVAAGEAALALARRVATTSHLHLAGLMGYEGHLVLIADPQVRAEKVRQAMSLLQMTFDLMERSGLPAPIVSGGGTGTYDVTATCPPVTEVQAGSYVFMDTTYLKVRPEFRPALALLATVVSRVAPGRIILDAGMKAVTREFGLPEVAGLEGVTVRHLSEEHATLELADPGAVALRPGDRVSLLPSHCCTTVNLHDRLYVVQRGALVDIWPIAARGCAQ